MRIAVISARYGKDVGGGAETLARGLLQELARRGHYAEVWTTCAKNYQTWKNHFPPGDEQIKGVHVRRFMVDPWDRHPFEKLTGKLFAKGRLPLNEQAEWIESGPSSRTLFEHSRRYHEKFDLVIAIPVISPLVFKAAWLALDRLVVWPCLHDEIFAYLEPIRLLMESAKGNIFNSPEEQDLALNCLYMNLTRSAIIGSGIELGGKKRNDPEYDLPYLLYVGRLDEGKNLPLLLEYAMRYTDEENQFRLKIAGRGSFTIPDHPAIECMGFVDEQEKVDLYRGALALCQPSINESFSLTIMESWFVGRPVLVHKNCAVTRGHAQRAKGGLWFATYGEFRGALNWFRKYPDLASRMGQNGRSYVRLNYSWPIVVDRFLSIIKQWQQDW